MTMFRRSQSHHWVNTPYNWSLQALLAITAVCVFVPFSPMMPAGNIDPSWVFGINEAVAQGLVFGREIVYTFGPYASIFTKGYHPATDQLMIAGSLYLGLSYAAAVFLVTRNAKWYWLIALWIVLAGLMHSRDALFFTYPLLVGIFCFQLSSGNQKFEFGPGLTLIVTAILFLPFGLFPLIKGTLVILCAVIATLTAALFLSNRNWMQATTVIAIPLVSILLFWIASGQLAYDLFPFSRDSVM